MSRTALGLEATVQTVEHLGYVQIDTISVVERAHHHILWSRVRDHRPDRLARMLKDRTIFEYWSHAASYLPMRDYRFSLPRKRLYAAGKRHWFEQTSEHKPWRRRILAQIRERGGQTARDFLTDDGRKRGTWFDRSPAKQMLEQLFMEGVLMISERRGFNKVYDLTERVLPADVDTRMPSPREYRRHLIVSYLRAQGLGRPGQISYLRRNHAEIGAECKRLLKEGILFEVKVDGLEGKLLALSDVPFETSAVRGCHILSPFDSFVIQRKRLIEFFDYDYTIGCYTPAAKRKSGYFGLPVVLDGEVVGHVDLKADRENRVLLVQGEYLRRLTGEQRARLKQALAEFAVFNGCRRVLRPSARTQSPSAHLDQL